MEAELETRAGSPLLWRSVEIAPPSLRGETLHVLRLAAAIACGAWFYIANTAPRETAAPAWADRGGGEDSAAGAATAAGSTGPAGGNGVRAATAAERDLMPYQRLFRTLSGDQQRMFRELQEGLLEAENRRAASGRWPAVGELASQGVPPFAASPLAPRALSSETSASAPLAAPGLLVRGVQGPSSGSPPRDTPRYGWRLRHEGVFVNYLGVATPPRPELPSFLLLVQEPDPRAPPDTAVYPPGDEQHHRLADGTLLHVSTWMRAGGGTDAAGETVISAPYTRGWTQLLAGAGAP